MKILKEQQGFTLIEVLTAFLLLSILATVVIAFFTNGFSSITKFGKRSEAMLTARAELEEAAPDIPTTIEIKPTEPTSYPPIHIYGKSVEQPIDGASGSSISVFVPMSNIWSEGTSYTLGDKVVMNGKTYTCTQPHVAIPGNKPTSSGGASWWKIQ